MTETPNGNESSYTLSALKICDDALTIDPDKREAFIKQACKGDAALIASVNTVLSAMASSGEFLQGNSEASEDLVGTTVGPFKITSLIGTGGMGSVYRASRIDDSFDQEVAIKVVRGQFMSPMLVDRFNAERQILAALHHPYVAALVDGGTTSDGAPYLVMEYVDGLPVDEYCNKHKLNLDERIAIIQKIAMAVQAAHQNLVIHRDLKPSNILVTADGIPKLLDFGIAKLIGGDAGGGSSNTTIYGGQALTPNYASPEQILENTVTTASDVYSLGVLSYELLVGERPYEMTVQSPLELVESMSNLTIPAPVTRFDTVSSDENKLAIANYRDTTPPQLKRVLSGDLKNILMKALDKEPSRRYESAAAYGKDLVNYSEGLPVSARPDSAWYRINRFAARHKFGVGASVVLFAVTLSALALISRAYVRAEAARADATEAFVSAEAARAEATDHFTQVRAIANTMMFDVYDEVSKLRGATKAKEILASSSQAYLGSLSISKYSTPEVRLDAGRGYLRLADVTGGVDQSLGKYDDAMVLYKKSQQILEDLVADFPDNVEYKAALGTTHFTISAHALYSENDVPLAKIHGKKSVDLFAEIEEESTEIMIGKITAILEYADGFDWDGKFQKTIDILNTAFPELEKIDTNPATHIKGARLRAKVYRDIGDAFYYVDNGREESVRYLKLARDIGREMLKHTDDLPAAERSLSITLYSLAGTEVDSGLELDSLVSIDESTEIAHKLHLSNPDDVGSLELYKTVAEQRSGILSVLGNHEEAIAEAKKTYDLVLKLNALTDDAGDAVRSEIISSFNVGTVHSKAKMYAKGCEWLLKARSGIRKLASEGTLVGYDKEVLGPDIDREVAAAGCDDL